MNLELVEQIVAVLGEYPLSEIAVEADGCRIHVRRPPDVFPGHSGPSVLAPASADAAGGADHQGEDTRGEASEAAPLETRALPAPMVGIFYHTKPVLSFGSEIVPGQVVGFIESMKLMNDVAAEGGGRITDILVEDGAPVEYGQTLFRLAAV